MRNFPISLKQCRTALLATAMASLVASCSNSVAENQKKTTSANSAPAPSSSPATSASAVTATVSANVPASLPQALAQNLTKSGITAKVQSISATQMPNMYWVKAEGLPAFFTDSTGQYIFQGDVVKIGGEKPEHISSDLQAKDAKATLASLDKKDMIIYPAVGATKGVIYVFTDADCGYCRKLHSEIKQTNELGIEVRYLPWPRSQESFPIMEKIWCSKDRNEALTKAKNGQSVDAPQCDNPVKKIHDIGTSLGVNGTPAIFTENGEQIGGYLPSQAIAKALKIQ